MSMKPSRASLAALALTAMFVIAGEGALLRHAHATQPDHATSPQGSESGSEQSAVGTEGFGDGAQGHDVQKETLCLTIESAALSNDLPLGFFARVIWQESHFQPDAVGPVTHSGRRALGIAQFMPETARERRLLDPFDPVQALPKAAEFLRDLRTQFGNLGLAAAAYNAGPGRIQQWLAGSGGMPEETRNYVQAITGISVEDWAKSGDKQDLSETGQRTSCREMIALLERAPNRFVSQLEQRVTRATVKPWSVQLAAGFNRRDALAKYAQAMKELNGIIGHQDDPLLFRVPGTSSFLQVRIGANTRRQADDLCGRIHRAGVACLVKRSRA
jgi:hypothetical protein